MAGDERPAAQAAVTAAADGNGDAARAEGTHPFVAEHAGLRSLQFDGLTVQSLMSVADPSALMLDYTRTMMGFLFFVPAPRHILMIGLGGGSLAKYCLARLPGARFTAVESDPEIIALRERFGIPADDERFRVVCADGADYLRDAPADADVLLVDGFSAQGMPPALGSADFYADCRATLAPGGVLIYETFAKGNERFGKPSNPAFLLDEGELLRAYQDRLKVIAYEDVVVDEPRPAAVQRLCAQARTA